MHNNSKNYLLKIFSVKTIIQGVNMCEARKKVMGRFLNFLPSSISLGKVQMKALMFYNLKILSVLVEGFTHIPAQNDTI